MNLARTSLLSLLFIILLLSACQYLSRPQAEVYQPPEKHPVIIKKDTMVRKPDSVQRDSFCIAAVGDIMLGSSYPNKYALPPDSAKGSFKNVLAALRNADITFGNLEGALFDTGAPAHYKLHLLSKGYLFRSPTSYASVLKDAGFKVLSLANNHIGDFGEPGRINTMKVLDSLGIYHGGQVSHPTSTFKINGVTYGFCAFAPNAYTESILELKRVRKIVSGLKQQCDIVIVSFHGGAEGAGCEHVPFNMELFHTEKRGDVHLFAHTAIDAGADLVLGNGPHVCRAMELYNGRLIAYSLGNFCTYTSVSVAGVCGLAPILKVNINKKGEFLNARIISATQTHYGGLQLDSLNKAAARIKQLTQIDFPDSGLSIGDDGTVVKLQGVIQ